MNKLKISMVISVMVFFLVKSNVALSNDHFILSSSDLKVKSATSTTTDDPITCGSYGEISNNWLLVLDYSHKIVFRSFNDFDEELPSYVVTWKVFGNDGDYKAEGSRNISPTKNGGQTQGNRSPPLDKAGD